MHRRSCVVAMWLALALVLGTAVGCTSDLTFEDTSLASDTRDGRGPFEIVTTIRGDVDPDAVRLFYRADGGPWADTGMQEQNDGRFHGFISPFEYGEVQAWPVGTFVEYYVEAADTGGDTARDPSAAPESQRFDFTIGTGSIAVLEVVPDEGPESGGTQVFIRGAGFHRDSQVFFGDNLAPEVVVVSPAFIRSTTPAGEGGFVDVIVTDPAGNQGVLEDGFRYIPAPVIVALDPDSGPTAGGTQVTITGEHFDQPVVTFDSVEAPQLSWTETQIVVTTPPHPAGPVDVVVTNMSDLQQGVLPAGYTYIPPPNVISADPPFGPSFGGTDVTVTGTGFQEGARVFFDGVVTPCTVVSATQLACRTLAHPPAVVDIEVVNPDGQTGIGRGLYEFLAPPTVTSVTPPDGPITGGTPVVIRGTGFIPGAAVFFGGVLAENCAVVSREEIRCSTPAFPVEGLVDVTVINPDDQSGTLEDGYLYTFPPPNIVTIEPNRGTDLGGTTVTLTVEWLKPGAIVTFDGIPCDVVSVDPPNNTLVCVTRPGTEGFVDVRVQNTDGQFDTELDGYRFLGPPRIFTINPPEGFDTGGTTVTITGENFAPGIVVTFDGLPATIISVTESTIVLSTPAHPRGTVDVTARNPDNRFDTATDGYEYIWAPPIITNLTPNQGGTWGGNEVIVSGSGFRPGDSTVSIGGIPLNPGDYVVVSSTRIDILNMPPGFGPSDVRVTNSDGQFGTATYTYVPIEISPDGGLTAGFTNIELTGFDFVAGTTVTIGALPPFTIDVQGPNVISVLTPAHSIGPKNVVVTLPDGRTETIVDGFTYREFRTASGTGLAASRNCQSLEVHDFNGDTRPDVVVGNGNVDPGSAFLPANTIQLNNGNGTFGSTSDIPNTLGQRNLNLDVGDFDGDGDLDLFDINIGNPSRLLRNNGAGGFTVANVLPGTINGLYDAGFLDMDLDNDMDLFLFVHEDDDRLLLNVANSYVDQAMTQDTFFNGHDHNIAIGDINGDNFPDVIATVDNTEQFGGSLRFRGRNRIYVNNGLGNFTVDTSQPITNVNGDILDPQLADIDGDGDLDLIMSDNIFPGDPLLTTSGHARNSVYLYTNDGNGNFTDDRARIPQGRFDVAYGVTLFDLDIDGDLDLMVSTCPDSNVSSSVVQDNLLFVNDGNGFFQDASASWPAALECGIKMQSADLYGDALPEIVVCNFDQANRILEQVSQ